METFEQFKENVLSRVKECPTNWRKGQSVFNIVDTEYGVARDVQFGDGVDCFYNDGAIDLFLTKAFIRLCQLNK